MFAPTIEVIKDDKAFLTEDPLITLEKGNFAKIPWITGIIPNLEYNTLNNKIKCILHD